MPNPNPEHTYIGMMAEKSAVLAENLGGDPKLVDKLKTTNVVGQPPAPRSNSPKQMKPLLEVKDLACGYQTQPVFTHVNLTLYPGQLSGRTLWQW